MLLCATLLYCNRFEILFIILLLFYQHFYSSFLFIISFTFLPNKPTTLFKTKTDMAHTLHNSEYLADIEFVASVMGTPDLVSLLHKTQCHDDPAMDFYNLWQYVQCTWRDSTEHVPYQASTSTDDKTDITYDAVMQHRAFVLHWVGYLKSKIHNNTLAKQYPLQATYGLQHEDVVGFMNLIQILREMACHLKARNTSTPDSESCPPIQETPSKKRSNVRRSARLAKKQRTSVIDTNDVIRGC